MTKTIYLSDAGNKLLEDIKKTYSDFNLSSFVHKMLEEYAGEEEMVNVEATQHRINTIDLEIQKLEEQKRFLISKIKKSQELRVKRDEVEGREVTEVAKSIYKYCDVGQDEALVLAKEYYKVRGQVSITRFIDDKGVPERKV